MTSPADLQAGPGAGNPACAAVRDIGPDGQEAGTEYYGSNKPQEGWATNCQAPAHFQKALFFHVHLRNWNLRLSENSIKRSNIILDCGSDLRTVCGVNASNY
jgi:hypothetical protein